MCIYIFPHPLSFFFFNSFITFVSNLYLVSVGFALYGSCRPQPRPGLAAYAPGMAAAGAAGPDCTSPLLPQEGSLPRLAAGPGSQPDGMTPRHTAPASPRGRSLSLCAPAVCQLVHLCLKRCDS